MNLVFDNTIIAGIIGAGGTVFAAILAWMLGSYKFSLDGLKKKRYRWVDIERGVQKMAIRFHNENFSNVVILSVPGSGSVVAGMFKKEIEKKTNHRYQSYNFLLESKSNPWTIPPPHHMRIETARFNLYIPYAITSLPENTTILIVDSIWITGDTVAKLRESLDTCEAVKVYYLMTVKNHAPGNTPPDFTAYESFDSNLMFPWGPAT